MKCEGLSNCNYSILMSQMSTPNSCFTKCKAHPPMFLHVLFHPTLIFTWGKMKANFVLYLWVILYEKVIKHPNKPDEVHRPLSNASFGFRVPLLSYPWPCRRLNGDIVNGVSPSYQPGLIHISVIIHVCSTVALFQPADRLDSSVMI